MVDPVCCDVFCCEQSNREGVDLLPSNALSHLKFQEISEVHLQLVGPHLVLTGMILQVPDKPLADSSRIKERFGEFLLAGASCHRRRIPRLRHLSSFGWEAARFDYILLMIQKSGKIHLECKNTPWNNGIFTISTGWHDFFHEQFHPTPEKRKTTSVKYDYLH